MHGAEHGNRVWKTQGIPWKIPVTSIHPWRQSVTSVGGLTNRRSRIQDGRRHFTTATQNPTDRSVIKAQATFMALASCWFNSQSISCFRFLFNQSFD
jgi:hypothetical protein